MVPIESINRKKIPQKKIRIHANIIKYLPETPYLISKRSVDDIRKEIAISAARHTRRIQTGFRYSGKRNCDRVVPYSVSIESSVNKAAKMFRINPLTTVLHYLITNNWPYRSRPET